MRILRALVTASVAATIVGAADGAWAQPAMWQGYGNAAARLAPHLDDTWAVAVRAARTLQSMGPAGAVELQARASRPDIGGLLARQMLWQGGGQRS